MAKRRSNFRIFIGNLPYSWNEAKVQKLFETFGEVLWVSLIQDPDSGRARGFGFVEMSEDDARKAIEKLDGSKHGGRILRVNAARPRPVKTTDEASESD